MIVNNVNPNKLHDELINAGLPPILVTNDRKEGQIVAENTWIIFEDGTDMNLVQQIIDAHDATPLPPKPSEKERLEALEQAMIEMIMGGM